MAPIGVRLDMLQDEKDAYERVLLPNLFFLVDMQREVQKFNYAKNLVNYLLKQPKPYKGNEKCLESMFSNIFDEFDLLMTSAQHLHIKLGVVRSCQDDYIRGNKV